MNIEHFVSSRGRRRKEREREGGEAWRGERGQTLAEFIRG